MKITRPEDFIVREIIDDRFLTRYHRISQGVEKGGKNTLFLMKKKNMNTRDAIKIVAEKFNVSIHDIGYAGLKDKFAVTYQHITVKGNHNPFHMENISLAKIGKTDRMISIGDLKGNEFEITLHGCKNIDKTLKKIRSLEEKGMPNYFGRQRFSKNNHLIGRNIVKKRKIPNAPKETIKFYVHAYQSFIFNKVLKRCEQKGIKMKTIPLIGTRTKIPAYMDDIMKKEGIRPDDFSFNGITCIGGSRKAFIKTGKIDYRRRNNTLELRFRLPKGSYATTLIEHLGG